MVTIALDENGDFEGFEDKGAEPIFLAGLLYDDRGDEQDIENERSRIIAYYESVCAASGGRFPQSLHMNHAGKNGRFVAMTKQEVHLSLAEFLRYGTYRGKALLRFPRRGKYTLFMQLKSNQGKKSLRGTELCKLVKDDFASNLYMHMAEDVVSRLIFHNPYRSDIDKVRFDLPTRMVVLDNHQKEKIKEYQKLGYKKYTFDKDVPVEPGKTYLQIANENNYRAAISREVSASGKTNLDVERMSVSSIYYGTIDKKRAERMAFLYMADSICSFLNWEREGNNPAEWMACFAQRAHELDGSAKNIFFAYDDVDMLFEQAWRAYEQGNYFKSLSLSFTAKKMQSSFADFYQKQWFPLLEEKICKCAKKSEMSLSLRRFREYSYEENLEQERLCYIFENLQKAVEQQMQQGKAEKSAVFDLYDAGFSAYNHTGQSSRAEQCFLKCKEFAPAVDIETYLRTLNKYAVWRNDVLDFEAAKETAEIIALYAKDLSKMRGELFGNEASESVTYGRAKSQCGQAYAFLKDEQAEAAFLEALSYLEKDSPDYFITLSYLLHDYIECGDVQKYDHYAEIYFGGLGQPEAQLDFLMRAGQGEEPRFTLKFAFFVFLKGLCKFHLDSVRGKLRKQLLDIEDTFRHYHVKDQINGHPWEIIYKYLAFIAEQQGKREIAADYLGKAAGMIPQGGPIIRAIIENGKREFANFIGDEKAAQDAGQKILEAVKQTGRTLDEDEILQRLCYMYD